MGGAGVINMTKLMNFRKKKNPAQLKMDSESQEYIAVLQCYPRLVDCIKQAPADLAVKLRPSGILASTDWEFLTNQAHNNDLKAIKIVDVVLNQIKTNPQRFWTFVFALEAAGPWTEAIVGELKPLVLRDTHTSLPAESGKLKSCNSIISHCSYTISPGNVNSTVYVVSQ